MPTKTGNFWMRTLVNGVDVSTTTGLIIKMDYVVKAQIRGPFKVFVGVGEVDNLNSPMEGPGLLARGNVAGFPVSWRDVGTFRLHELKKIVLGPF